MQDGEIGKVEQVIITSCDPAAALAYINVSGGLFRDMMIRDLGIARLVAGDIGAADDVDNAMALLRSKSGALVRINNRRAVCGLREERRHAAVELPGRAGGAGDRRGQQQEPAYPPYRPARLTAGATVPSGVLPYDRRQPPARQVRRCRLSPAQ